ncbi:hypothetical protein BC834DRAFT_857837 [Gloeopeniophorella convolvens]|nr:hypothetical protein BC834DRAFT_857837 [Gloeopeniophorella convolvens]
MVANASVAAGAEVFNTYGATLSNAELLVRYGFLLDANEHDVLTFATDEVWAAAGIAHAPAGTVDLDGWAGVQLSWASSALVSQAEPGVARAALHITADGALSSRLWLAAALAALGRQGARFDVGELRTRALVARMARLQLQLEQGEEGSEAEEDRAGDADAGAGTAAAGDRNGDAMEALGSLARTIGALCARRLDRVCRRDHVQGEFEGCERSPGLPASAVVGEYIDKLGVSWHKTRLAALLALGEMSILESCGAGWDELAGALEDMSARIGT